MKKLITVLVIIGFVVLFTIIYLGGAMLEGYIVMKLWNWAMVGIFPSLPTLTWLKTTGILILLNLIFPLRYVRNMEGRND